MILEAHKAEEHSTSMQEHVSCLSNVLPTLQESQQPKKSDMRTMAKYLDVPQKTDGAHIEAAMLFETIG